MEKQCIHCSRWIHKEASYCHYCGKSQITKQKIKLPRPRSKKKRYFAATIVLLLSFLAIQWMRSDNAFIPASLPEPIIEEKTAEQTPEKTEKSESTPTNSGKSETVVSEQAVPLKVIWYDLDEITDSRPDKLRIFASGTDYRSEVKLSEEQGWTAEIPYSEEFQREGTLKTMQFVITDDIGNILPYRQEVYYQNQNLCVDMRYRLPIVIQWDDQNNAGGQRPESLMVSMTDDGNGERRFRCRITITDEEEQEKTVPLEWAYVNGSTDVLLYTDESGSRLLLTYIPTLSYDETTASLTLTLSLADKAA